MVVKSEPDPLSLAALCLVLGQDYDGLLDSGEIYITRSEPEGIFEGHGGGKDCMRRLVRGSGVRSICSKLCCISVGSHMDKLSVQCVCPQCLQCARTSCYRVRR